MKKILDAVSIVMTCGDEIFAIQRQNFLRAFPGYWAFPGGKVEEGDDIHSSHSELVKNLDPKLLGAAVREGQEELGIDLREEIASGRVERVDLLGLAVTPDFNPYRFATYFFRFHFREKVSFKVDENEAQVAKWITCQDLLNEYEHGRILAVPPVIKVIETLGKTPETQTITDLNFAYDSDKYVPYIESIKGVRQFMPLSNTLPPANRTNAFLIGDEGADKIFVDPSPGSEEEYQKLKNTVSDFGVNKIFLTHHHLDHHERSTDLAREWKLPVLLSADTHQRILKKRPEYFSGVETQIVKEGDILTRWIGRDVQVYEVPGHDEGQLALAPVDMSWFLAGDLFQGVGTVVIGGDEGDMSKYFATLEKVITLSPRVLFPSHGIGLGGTSILERTLEHRRVRENQILNLHQAGHDPDQMLEIIYADTPKGLWPYAKANILKHLDKLRLDGRITN